MTSAKRSPAAPNIPTIAESGLPGFEATSWFALLGAGGHAARRADAHQRRDAKVLAMPDVKEKLASLGLDVHPARPRRWPR